MCFSATASFVVGGVLTLAGAVTLKRASSSYEIPLAAMPLLFGIQQMIEGVLWLSFQYEAAQLKTLTTYMYTIFSHILWPIYVPIAIALIEQNSWRRRLLWGLSAVGIITGGVLGELIATHPLNAVLNEHLVYVVMDHYDWPMMVAYITATCLAPLFSSYSLIRLLGCLVFLMFIVTYWFYTVALFSVWCFFAAILSSIIYLFFRGERT